MDDNNLITLLQQGDRNAYKQLFIKYYSPLCEYASQYISDDDSEELVQELMLFLWETRENLVIETSLKSYLFISTKHRCLNAIRKNQLWGIERSGFFNGREKWAKGFENQRV